SWNWMAALFPLEWALARKQKRLFLGLMACWLPMAVLSMVALFWALPGLDAVSLFAMLAGGQTGEMAFGPWLLWQLAAFGRWCMRLYMATRANHHYRRHTTMAIRAIPPGSESVRRAALRRAGGLSLPAVALFYGVCGVLFALGLVICGKM
ncbi:MAG: hypothetical protein J6K98_00500, partial [Clostridia bacterium]|nr:hypothetical protein [Clostridia bacterium]